MKMTSRAVTPRRLHIAMPVLIMGILYWLSSITGTPLPDDPAHYALFRWISPSVQNILHVPAFAALSCAWCWALRAWQRVQVVRLTAAFAITAAYGVSDEWHQSFVPGRYASLTDVVLDVGGGVLGIWVAARFRS
jgi:VanZ family protein